MWAVNVWVMAWGVLGVGGGVGRAVGTAPSKSTWIGITIVYR